MKRYDFNCFAGAWPFYKLRIGTVAEMIALHQEKGINGGIVSSLNSIFYQDPLEGDLDLAKELSQRGYQQFLTVNPLRIGFLEGLKQGIESINPAGVRIYPGFHGYSLLDEKMDELCRFLEEVKLPLAITQRMQDARITYLLHPTSPNKEEWQAFLKKHPNLSIFITNMSSAELLNIKEEILGRNNVFFDASGLNQTPFPIEHIIKEGLGEKLLFGSNAPLNSLSATLQMALSEEISEEILAGMFSGEKLF